MQNAQCITAIRVWPVLFSSIGLFVVSGAFWPWLVYDLPCSSGLCAACAVLHVFS